jgi:hypothetical protein
MREVERVLCPRGIEVGTHHGGESDRRQQSMAALMRGRGGGRKGGMASGGKQITSRIASEADVESVGTSIYRCFSFFIDKKRFGIAVGVALTRILFFFRFFIFYFLHTEPLTPINLTATTYCRTNRGSHQDFRKLFAYADCSTGLYMFYSSCILACTSVRFLNSLGKHELVVNPCCKIHPL